MVVKVYGLEKCFGVLGGEAQDVCGGSRNERTRVCAAVTTQTEN